MCMSLLSAFRMKNNIWDTFTLNILRIHIFCNEQYTQIPLIYSKVDLLLAFDVGEGKKKKYICAVTKTLKIVYIMLVLDTMLMLMLKKYVCAYQMCFIF